MTSRADHADAAERAYVEAQTVAIAVHEAWKTARKAAMHASTVARAWKTLHAVCWCAEETCLSFSDEGEYGLCAYCRNYGHEAMPPLPFSIREWGAPPEALVAAGKERAGDK